MKEASAAGEMANVEAGIAPVYDRANARLAKRLKGLGGQVKEPRRTNIKLAAQSMAARASGSMLATPPSTPRSTTPSWRRLGSS